MKHNILNLFIALFLLASCQQEEPAAMSGCGYLALSVQTDEINVVMTRAEEDDAPLAIELWKGETKQKELTDVDMQGKIALEEGDDYKIVAYTASYKASDSWTDADKGEAVYHGEYPFVVEAGKTTTVDAEVPMINFGVKLVLPEGFEKLFPAYTFTVTSGEREVTLKNGETAYFPSDNTTVFSYVLEATNVDDEEQTAEGSYDEEIVSGTIYTVTYALKTQSLRIEQ